MFAIPTLAQVQERQKKNNTLPTTFEPRRIESDTNASASTSAQSAQHATLSSSYSSSSAPAVTSSSSSSSAPKSKFAELFGHLASDPNYVTPEAEIAKAEAALRLQQQQQQQAASASSSSSSAAAAAAPNITRKIGARTLLVSKRQKQNPVLNYIKNVPWEYCDCLADFVFGSTSCGLFLSLKFHVRSPTYILGRMEQLRQGFSLRVLLVLVDLEENQPLLIELEKAAIVHAWTLICCWSTVEAARYLETFKAFESKTADSIQERQQTDYSSRAADVLTCIRSVNKTNSVTLLSTFQSMAGVMTATTDRIALCPGLGEKKVRRLYTAMHEPFKKSRSNTNATNTNATNTNASSSSSSQQK